MTKNEKKALGIVAGFALWATLLVLAVLFASCFNEESSVTAPPPILPELAPACVLPSEIQASLTPALPVACAGNACVANRSIDASSPPFIAATWTTPGAVQVEHSGVNGTVSYPFSTRTVTHEWSVLACTDPDRLCCRGTNGTVTFNGGP